MTATSPIPDRKVTAVLGPTNTGKTHLAIERMLGHARGQIGFPLRLLARENYDRIVKAKGRGAAALITGEEKIAPPTARYFVCTVESMPLDLRTEFLAIDEIQLAADPERGHVFTDRLLWARGTIETMFLGAETIAPMIRKLVPNVTFETRRRLSTLSYAGYRKLTRLPARSAVVAFSATDVYAIAELIRRERGGTAVVLGALSPRARNAQVAMYQEREVDYLVATDAIGMGLNMDIDHVAFAKLTKFDGQVPRRLLTTEIAQIAGRAGRHMNDGTFGVTAEVGELDEEIVENVQNHEFDDLKAVMWRNSDLDFRSPDQLVRSLNRRAVRPELIRAREADDQHALQILARDSEIADRAKTYDRTALLWEVCQIPDFRKTLSDAHIRLLRRIYLELTGADGVLPKDWVDDQVARLDTTEGDIDTLMARIAHIRTWTYVSHKGRWLNKADGWQERTRQIEDRLSDALHDRLTNRFVDRRSAMLARSLAGDNDLLAAVRKDGTVLVEGHAVGHLEGFRFIPDVAANSTDRRAMLAAARRGLGPEITARVRRLEQSDDGGFDLTEDARILWDGAPIARLVKGATPLEPGVKADDTGLLGHALTARVEERLSHWIADGTARILAPLITVRDADLAGPGRGIAFQLVEALGAVARSQIETLIKDLTKADRSALRTAGVRLGPLHAHLPDLNRPVAVRRRAILWCVFNGHQLPAPVPPAGRVSIDDDPAMDGHYLIAIGYARAGPKIIRQDMLDRVLRLAHKKGDGKSFALDPEFAQLIGCGNDALGPIFEALGFRRWQTPKPAETETPSAPEIRYSLHPRRPGPKSKRRRSTGNATAPAEDKAVPIRRRADPDSPFAVLKKLAIAQ